MRRASWCGRSARWCSDASATSSAASTRSWSRSSSWASRRSPSACCRPSRRSAGWRRSCWCRLRLLQGLALGGEYGGAATYVAEHAPQNQARLRHGWIQTTATLGLVPLADRHLPLPLHRLDDAGAVRRLGLAAAVPGLAGPADLLGLHPAEAERIAGVPADEGRGQGLEGAAARQLPQVPEQQVRAARAARRDGRSGRGLVHRPVLRAVLPDDHAEARRRDRPTR